MNASRDVMSSFDTHHVAVAVTDTTDAPGARGSVQDAGHLKQHNGQEQTGVATEPTDEAQLATNDRGVSQPSMCTDHVALAEAGTTQSSPRDLDPAIGRPASSPRQVASQNPEPQGALELQGVGSSTSSQSSEDSLRIVVVEPWEWHTCKCEPKGPTMTKIIPGERHLRCFACGKPRGPP